MTGMRVSIEVEDGGVEVSTGGRCAGPGSIGFREAEVRTFGVTLEPSVHDIILSFVPSGEGDFKVALPVVYRGRSISGDEVLQESVEVT